jgi:hypothetical protein
MLATTQFESITFPSPVLKTMLKIHRDINYFLYNECETLCLILIVREKHTLRVFENRMLRKYLDISYTCMTEKLREGELQNLRSSPNITMLLK